MNDAFDAHSVLYPSVKTIAPVASMNAINYFFTDETVILLDYYLVEYLRYAQPNLTEK